MRPACGCASCHSRASACATRPKPETMTAMKSWDAAQYTRFEAERNRPIHDLLAQLPDEGIARAVDVGCGPGNSTELMMRRWPGAEVTGFDSSAEMVEAARKRLPEVHFTVADV